MNHLDTIMFKEISEQPEILKGMRARLLPVVSKIAEKVKKKKISFITTAARGSSNNACTYFKYLSEIYCGLPIHSAAPSVYTVYDGKLNIKNQLVIGVSQSGKAADAILVMEKAKAAGSITVALTNFEDSPMAKIADFHLFLGTGEEKSVAATKTFTGQMYALLLLAEALSGDKTLSSAAERIASGVQETLLNMNEIVSLADKLTNLQSAFFLGRGPHLGAALECALKMQETTYIKAKAFAASDFHHGPFAMVDNESMSFLLMPEGKVFKDLEELRIKCEEAGGKTIIFTDTSAKGNFATVKIPFGSDVETPFYSVVAMQSLVNALSIKKGLSPDTPRGLNKVTITM